MISSAALVWLVKEQLAGGWGLEAGSSVKAHGTACFPTKLVAQHNAVP